MWANWNWINWIVGRLIQLQNFNNDYIYLFIWHVVQTHNTDTVCSTNTNWYRFFVNTCIVDSTRIFHMILINSDCVLCSSDSVISREILISNIKMRIMNIRTGMDNPYSYDFVLRYNYNTTRTTIYSFVG